MDAVVFDRTGGPEVLRLAQRPDPTAGPGQVRIQVRAISVNPADAKLRSGRFGSPDLPSGLGYDAAGVVDQVGDGVDHVAVGDEVFGIGNGAYATVAVLDAAARKPRRWSFEQAAGAGVAGETALRGLDLLGVRDGSTVVIDGAAGGVGVFAVQLAAERGARVIGTASPGNHDFLRSMGATPVAYGSGLAARVADLAPDGVDGVLDLSGRTDPAELISMVAEPADVVTIANFDAADTGIRLTDRGTDRAHALARLAEIADRSHLDVPIHQVFDLAQAADAHALSETGHVRGKLILRP